MIFITVSRSTPTADGLSYQNGARAGSQPTFRADGLLTPMATSASARIAVGLSSPTNHGPGPPTIMAGGARCGRVADGPGCRAKLGRRRGCRGDAVGMNHHVRA